MIEFSVDLTNCDKEPIHILGKVQSHGFLVAVNVETGLVTYISENIESFINHKAHRYLGKSWEELAKELKLNIVGSTFIFGQVLSLARLKGDLDSAISYATRIDKKPYTIILTISGGELLLEFEPVAKDEFDMQRLIGQAISRILNGKTVTSLLGNATEQVKNIISFDRVMVYKFLSDGHGHVVAEYKNDNLDPFLGLHYPASDIPKQARELYKINLTRIIADVNSQPSPILSHADGQAQLDLTYSQLRAVSPIHIQYLKNMGVQSSFSISLLVKGELWGLIACHNYTPRFISYQARDAVKLIAQILSSALEYRQGEEDAARFGVLNETAVELILSIEKEDQLVEALTAKKVSIKDITFAAGVALLYDNTITTKGITPTDEQINDIARWLRDNIPDSVYHTDAFPSVFSPAKHYTHVASGILACLISKEKNEYIIWFKPEQIQKVNWAGNPDKPVEQSADGLHRIMPRTSFESWTQMVQDTSEQWSRAEIASVINIREHIIYTIKRKANRIQTLNDQLLIAYEELNTFSLTVSHDLRTPLSSIKSYSEILLANNTSLDESAKYILKKIKSCTDKMALLIKEILNYSKVGKSEIVPVTINMHNLLDAIKTEALETDLIQNLELTIGNTPNISGDEVMINQVFTNLVNNAVKYSSKSNPSKVHIEGSLINKEVIYTISDNGIGIDTNYYSRVFELFTRMDNVREYEGTGVGLAIVKRIIEKHRGRIWFDSTLGIGTTFHLAFIVAELAVPDSRYKEKVETHTYSSSLAVNAN